MDTEIAGNPARPCGHVVKAIGIARDAGNRTDRKVSTEGPFGHVRFREDDGAGRAKSLHHEGISAWNESLHGQRTACGRQIASRTPRARCYRKIF